MIFQWETIQLFNVLGSAIHVNCEPGTVVFFIEVQNMEPHIFHEDYKASLWPRESQGEETHTPEFVGHHPDGVQEWVASPGPPLLDNAGHVWLATNTEPPQDGPAAGSQWRQEGLR